MARCWSCGAGLPEGLHLNYWLTCPTCTQVEETRKIRETLESSGAQSFYEVVTIFGPDIGETAGILEAGFGELSEQLANIASILEWGFEEIDWRLDQISETLENIDRTLKSPAITRAREWRRIAEELRRRKVLDKSKRFFLKSLDANPLDYRTYIGLGKTYFELGSSWKARFYWEESLPYAPKGEIDYKSYTYRLLGRLDFCEENYQQAASKLKTSIELSPNYWIGHYDYAQYCALIGDEKNCLDSLKIAILNKKPLEKLARKERNFDVLGNKIREFFVGASVEANEALSQLEAVSKEFRSGYVFVKSNVKVELISLKDTELYKLGEFGLIYGKKKEALGDYGAFLEVKSIAEECIKCLQVLKFHHDYEWEIWYDMNESARELKKLYQQKDLA